MFTATVFLACVDVNVLVVVDAVFVLRTVVADVLVWITTFVELSAATPPKFITSANPKNNNADNNIL